MPQTATDPPSPAEIDSLRAVIGDFLQQRLQTKLDKLKAADDGLRDKAIAEHQPSAWLASAAQRVGQIQQVTHAIKFTHPDAKGSSLSCAGNPQAGDARLGSHSVASGWVCDVVGNAAALDVFKFLKLTVNGRSLLDRSLAGDTALAAALADDAGTAAAWMQAFASLPESKGPPASHKLAKQVYWPLADGSYHLLAPLFPSALTHVVWQRLRADRFSDAAKAARAAQRARQPHPHGFCEYPHLVIQNFGGSQPQNISQLNSERGGENRPRGENWLLPSLPPHWQASGFRPPWHIDSIFPRRFGKQRQVDWLTQSLRELLSAVAAADYNNRRIREQRAEWVSQIIDELLQFAARSQSLPAGWSSDPRCQLDLAERYWLDPGRAETDTDFAHQRAAADWRDEICRAFARWLNAALSSDKARMGLVEAKVWQNELAAALSMIRTELDDHE